MMISAISGLRIVPQQAATATLAASVNQAATVTDTPATQVTLGQDTRITDADTYSSLRTPAVRYAWQNENALDKLSMKMYGSVTGTSIGARFQGLGASLIEQLAANGGQRVSQSALVVGDSSATTPGALELQRAHLREHASNSITLNLTTASGATVSIGLYSDEQGLAVDASVANGELNAAELKALAKIADGFQQAVDGLAQDTPNLKLDGLLQVDQSLFSGVQMNASLKLASGEQQTFDLRLDGSQRSLSLQGPDGQVKLELDSQDGALLGNQAQRSAALNNYLTQFDAARQRGQGDKQLNTLFKDAFRQLNSVDDDSTRPANHDWKMNTLSRSLLSGLADFKASISQTTDAPNPIRQNEVDHFDYSVSQSTSKVGKGNNFSVQQDQQSSLKAAWHTSLDPRVDLLLTRDNKTQNYRYYQVNDQASSSTRTSIVDGALQAASTTREASQSERVQEYVKGDLKSDKTTADSERKAQDQRNLIDTLLERDARSRKLKGISSVAQDMASNSRQWLLQGNPSRL